MTFLVAGATGNVGGAVVRALAARGHAVRALSRSAHPSAPAGWAPGVEVVTGDLDRPETVAGSLRGVHGVFLLSGYADMPGLLAEVRRAGVGRVVLLSSSSVPSGDMDNAVTAYHIRSEQAVRESGMPYSIVRPSAFMSNTLQWVDQLAVGDVIRAPFPDAAAAVIDPDDIGEGYRGAAGHRRPRRAGAAPERTAGPTPGGAGAHPRRGTRAGAALRGPDQRAGPRRARGHDADAVRGSVPQVLRRRRPRRGRGAADRGHGARREPHDFRSWVTAHADAFRARTSPAN